MYLLLLLKYTLKMDIIQVLYFGFTASLLKEKGMQKIFGKKIKSKSKNNLFRCVLLSYRFDDYTTMAK